MPNRLPPVLQHQTCTLTVQHRHCILGYDFPNNDNSGWFRYYAAGFDFPGDTCLVWLHHCTSGFSYQGNTSYLAEDPPIWYGSDWWWGFVFLHSIAGMLLPNASARGICSSSQHSLWGILWWGSCWRSFPNFGLRDAWTIESSSLVQSLVCLMACRWAVSTFLRYQGSLPLSFDFSVITAVLQRFIITCSLSWFRTILKVRCRGCVSCQVLPSCKVVGSEIERVPWWMWSCTPPMTIDLITHSLYTRRQHSDLAQSNFADSD